mgnify:FL=1
METTELVERLKKLGIKAASNKIEELKNLKFKMAIAYEHFRFVTPEKIKEFNEKLKGETLREDKKAYYYKHLIFIKLEEYQDVPPLNVLNDLEKAQQMNCFDYYEVAKIEDKIERKDPIIFGRINKCPDRFFITQWEDDVKIEDILKENEG